MPNERRKQRRAADWSPVLDRIRHIQHLSRAPPKDTRGYQAHIRAGKQWVRERIKCLVDEGSFQEIGSVTGTAEYEEANKVKSFVPTNMVTGLCKLNCRPVALAADDFTIRAGHADGALYAKAAYIEQLAQSLKMPLIRLIDGASGGGSVAVYKEIGFTYIPPSTGAGWQTMVDSLSVIPVIGCILGASIGLGAAKASTTHFSVICAPIGSLFNAGPVVVEAAGIESGLSNAELGGPEVVCTNGAIDNFGATEEECFAIIRKFLSYLPSSVLELPPTRRYDAASVEERARRHKFLDTCIPNQSNRAYAIRPVIEALVDADSWFEVGPKWGSPCVAGLARVRGRPCGMIAWDTESASLGNLTAEAAKKLKRHVELCSRFGLPIVQLVDMSGFAIGSAAERAGTMRAGVDAILSVYQASVPFFNVVIRKCYGVAGAFLVDNKLPHFRIAWPSGEWGSLPLAGGIEAAYAWPLKQAMQKGGPEARKDLYEKLKAEFDVLGDPVRTAINFGIEEIVQPSQTRAIVAGWLERIYEVHLPMRLKIEQLKHSLIGKSLL
ncbi:hypothetical protein PYCC9005_001027 [Savitreella phatthalungensis]